MGSDHANWLKPYDFVCEKGSFLVPKWLGLQKNEVII